MNLKHSYTEQAEKYWASWMYYHGIKCDNKKRVVELLCKALVEAHKDGRRYAKYNKVDVMPKT